MTPSRKSFYALKALLCLAFLQKDEVISVRVVADRQGIPLPFLGKIFLDLRRSGLVRSIRGVQGGYCLGKHPRLISVKAVFEATGEVWQPFGGEDGEDWLAMSLGRRLDRKLAEVLGEIFLEDLYYDARSRQAICDKESWFVI